jgi:cytochrome d ubiquinol oxidase subunit II
MMSWEALQIIWFILIGILLAGYSILDGFDLGIGTLLPFLGKKEDEKRILMSAIGPFWDGNEVWLLTGGGALFAAFPLAYASVFSGFYLALMLVLFALILRAVSLEFRKYDEKRKKFWEWNFIIGSFLPSLLYGVALGNVIIGIPLNTRGDFTGTFFTLLRPFPLAVGLLGFTAILMQGTTFAALKTKGSLQQRARDASKKLWFLYKIFLAVTFILTMIYSIDYIKSVPAWICTALLVVFLLLLRKSILTAKDNLAFLMSSLSFICLWGITGAVHFPNLVKARNDPSLSLTITNSSSSPLTLKVMLIIAAIGMPLVIAYTIYLYKVFRGKPELDEGIY